MVKMRQGKKCLLLVVFHSIIVDNNLICVLFSGEKGITQDKSEAQICDRTSTFSMRLNGTKCDH